MMKQSVRELVWAAVLAALYVVLNLLQNLLLPGTTSMAIQFRVAEALCVFALFTPSAISGLTVGCLLYNVTNAGALPLDFFVGTLATLISTLMMYRLRKVQLHRLPLLSMLMPVLVNSVFIGAELSIFVAELPIWLNMLYVAVGELAVMLVPGFALYLTFRTPRLHRALFGERV